MNSESIWTKGDIVVRSQTATRDTRVRTVSERADDFWLTHIYMHREMCVCVKDERTIHGQIYCPSIMRGTPCMNYADPKNTAWTVQLSEHSCTCKTCN